MPRLENWPIGTRCVDSYQAPELKKRHLNGLIYDDEKGRFLDGAEVSTSTIQELNLEKGYAMTRNTRYELGEPDKLYIEWLEDQGKTLEDCIG